MGLLVIAAIIGFFWVCSKISQANREQEEREARARREAEQRRLREIQERAAAEERRKREAYLQRRRTDPYFDMMERQKEEREKEAKRQAELTRRRNLAAQFIFSVFFLLTFSYARVSLGMAMYFYKDARLRRITRYRYNNVPIDMGGR